MRRKNFKNEFKKRGKQLNKLLSPKNIISAEKQENGFLKIVFKSGAIWKIKGELLDELNFDELNFPEYKGEIEMASNLIYRPKNFGL